MVEEILLWPPVLWTLRLVTLIVLAAIGLAVFLLLARFLRPMHLKAMLMADIPRVSEIGGEVAGNKIAIKLDQTQSAQIEALVSQVAVLETNMRRLAELGRNQP